MFNQLAELCTESWKSHRAEPHTHTWNQPTDFRQQLIDDLDVQSWPGYMDGIERRQATVFAHSMMMCQRVVPLGGRWHVPDWPLTPRE